MGNFNFIATPIEDLYVIEPTVRGDDRGYFMEIYNAEFIPYIKHLDGTPASFVQDNESHSKKGVLRGMHMQKNNPQGKLVRATKGTVYDVAVDIRKGSKTFGQHYGVILSEENKRQFYVPEGFLHGFLVLSEDATFVYKCTRLYDPSGEYGVQWDDPELGIEWPIEGLSIQLSEKDKKNISFRELRELMKNL